MTETEADHATLLLIPQYRQKVKSSKAPRKLVRCWFPEAIEKLQGCCACTDWDVFPRCRWPPQRHRRYVNCCVVLCIPLKKVRHYNNNKLWFNKDIRDMRNEKNSAHLSGKKEEYMADKYKLRSAIRRLEEQITTSDTCFIWKDLQNMKNYLKKPTPTHDSNNPLLDTRNLLYGRFKQAPASSPSFLDPLPPSPSMRRRWGTPSGDSRGTKLPAPTTSALLLSTIVLQDCQGFSLTTSTPSSVKARCPRVSKSP